MVTSKNCRSTIYQKALLKVDSGGGPSDERLHKLGLFRHRPFQREKREYSELREDFKTFRGIRPFREIRVDTHHFL